MARTQAHKKLQEQLATALRSSPARVVEIQDTQLVRVGENLSSRIPLSIQTDDGVHQGFFTADVRSTAQADQKAALKTRCAAAPSYAKYLRLITHTRVFRNISRSYSDMERYKRLDAKSGSHRAWNRALWDASVSDAEIDALSKDGKFSAVAFQYAEDVSKINDKYNRFQEVGIDPSSGIDKRNSAMSTVADLLGMPKLLAKSTPMCIVKDGKTILGTFMEYANGIDLNNAPANSPLYQCDIDSVQRSTVYQDIANLQVLDYICGNADRHLGNIFYQVDDSNPDRPMLSGLMGIDNDCSFGTIRSAKISMVPPLRMKLISENTANIVRALDISTLKTVLQQYEFTPDEFAALEDRLQQVKAAISSKENALLIIKDGEWDNLSPTHVKAHPTSFRSQNANLFDNIYAQLNTMNHSLEDARVRELHIQKELARNPGEKKAEITRATSGDISPLHPAVIRINQEKLSSLLSRLEQADQHFVINSKKFKQMKQRIQVLCKANSNLPENPTPFEFAQLEQCYLAVSESATAYLAHKGVAASSKLAQRRAGIAEETKAFVAKQAERLLCHRREDAQASVYTPSITKSL